MIGRFSRLGAFQGFLRYREFVRCLTGGALALIAFGVERAGGSPLAVLILGLGAVAINGAPIVLGAMKGLLARRVNVDELVSLAIVASLLQGQIQAAAVISFIMILGSLIEESVSDRARRSIKSLVELAPQEAVLVTDDGRERTVPVAEIRVGDRVLVRPGERIPVDAVIVSGITAVDEAAITGESLPVERHPGDQILAGTMNYTGRIEARAVKVGEDTTFGKVVSLVVAAEAGKPRAARMVDRYATWFTPLVLGLAGLTWLVTGEAGRAVAVLVAGCPCALILAAPTATVAAIGRAARRGMLIKGGQFLEEAAKSDTVLFDKTGTLTHGRPTLETVATREGISPETVIGLAASLEQDCSHPLAAAVMAAAAKAGIAVRGADSMVVEVGLGVRGTVGGVAVEVGSPVLTGGEEALPPELAQALTAIRGRGATGLVVRRAGQAIGVLGVADTVRETAAATVAALSTLGIDTVGVLSGDHAQAVAALAGRIGITASWSDLRPADKLTVLQGMQEQGRRVLFVGDGINDAPALARANVGVAMGGAGTDVALETADVALTNDDIGRLPYLVALGRRMVGLIGWGIGVALSLNAVAIFGGAYGVLSPIAAAIFHNASSILVVFLSASVALTPDPMSGRRAG